MTIADKTFTGPWDIFPENATGQELGHAANLWDLFTREVTFGGASGANVITVPDNVASGLELVDAGGIEYMRVDTQNAQPQVHWNFAGADIDFRWEAVGVDPALFIRGSDGFVGIGVIPTAGYHVDVRDNTLDTTITFVGFRADHTKTAGVTDFNDIMIGGQFVIRIDQVGGEVGNTYGVQATAQLTNGTIGVVGNVKNIQAFRIRTDLNGGTVTDNAFGAHCFIDQEAANTISNDAYVCWLQGDFDGTVAGAAYMLYLKESTGVDYGIYQDGSADNYLGGRLGVGIAVPAAQAHIDQASTTAAIPVLYLDQADISEAMIEFATTIGVGNAIEAVGGKTLTVTHFIKCTIPGPLTRYFPVGTIA